VPEVSGTLLSARCPLQAEFGHGGMGVVYRAHDTLPDREIADKVLPTPELGVEGRPRLDAGSHTTGRCDPLADKSIGAGAETRAP
jgi:hypothetical protein